MKLVICSRRQRVQCFNRSQWIVWYSKSIVNRVYFEKFLFSSCSVLVQFVSILINMLRSKCPHLKTNWPLLRLHVEMNAFSRSFLLIFEWYTLGLLYTRIFSTRCNRMALTTRTHIHLKRKTTQSIDICIHKSHSIYQRNDVTQKKNESIKQAMTHEQKHFMYRKSIGICLAFATVYQTIHETDSIDFFRCHSHFHSVPIEWNAFYTTLKFSFFEYRSLIYYKIISQESLFGCSVIITHIYYKYDILLLSTVWLSAFYWGLKMILYVAICSSRSSGFVDFHHLTTGISSTDI